MSGGTIDGREINAVTINDDIATVNYTYDGGYKICLKFRPAKITLPGNKFPFVVPAYCDVSRKAQRTKFCIPSKGGCVS